MKTVTLDSLRRQLADAEKDAARFARELGLIADEEAELASLIAEVQGTVAFDEYERRLHDVAARKVEATAGGCAQPSLSGASLLARSSRSSRRSGRGRRRSRTRSPQARRGSTSSRPSRRRSSGSSPTTASG